MNKELIEQIQEALQAQRDTIERQNQIIEWREQEIARKNKDIAQLTASLRQLAASQSQELKALPMLFKDLEISMNRTTTTYQSWSQAQEKRQDSQKELTNELIKVANRQVVLTKSLTSYQQDMMSLDSLKSDAKMLDQKLTDIQKTQNQENSASDDLSKTQREIEQQVKDLSELLQKL